MFIVLRILDVPGVAALVVQQAGVIVAFVKVFEDAGQDFGDFVG